MRMFRRLRSLVAPRGRAEPELDEELESFVELLVREKTEQGLDPGQARRLALLELGGKESLKERVRENWAGERFRVFFRDLRFGARMLSRSPGFALVIVLTLSFGIGSVTAVFSVVHGVLLGSLPYPEPDRLVYLWTHSKEGRSPFSAPDFVELREQSTSLEAIAAIQGSGLVTLAVDGRPEPVRARDVSTNFLSVYGVAPYLGRTFRDDEDAPIPFELRGDPSVTLPTGVILISFELFRDRFDSDPAVLGKLVQLDLNPYQIIGVTPPGFRTLIPAEVDYAVNADVWSLSRMDFPRMPRDVSFLRAVARLRPGATLEQAQAEATRFADLQRERFPLHRESGFSIEVVPLGAALAESEGTTIWVLFGAVGFVLLIACANLANLLLSRWSARQRELAVRSALGAERNRLVRQLLTESLLYAVLGGGVGLVLCRFFTGLFTRLAPASLPRVDEIAVNGTVLAFSLLATCVAALLVGLVPALRFSRPKAESGLRGAGRETSALEAGRWNGVLVVAEVALAVVLVIGMGLLLRSLVTLLRLEPGFRPERVLTCEMSLSSRRYPRYPRADRRVQFSRRVSESLADLPGVEAVGLALVVPLSGQDAGHTFANEDISAGSGAFPPAKYRPVTPGYFDAVGTRILAGRAFDWQDLEQERLVTIVDERLARKAWPGEDPLGKRLRIEVWSTRNGPIALEPLWTEVVGVVENVRSSELDRDDRETVYLPYSLYAVSELSLLVRSSADPAALTDGVRERIARIDPDIAVFNFREMDDWVRESLAARRFSLTLLSAFGVAGLALALVGIYAVLASAVSLRRREIGLRLALGAAPGEVASLVISRGAALTAMGLLLGLLGAAALSRLLASQLYGVGALDVTVYATVAAFIAVVSLAACYLPARQATRIDPMRALRVD